MKITVRYLDCCRSDYFQGWDLERGPCICIPVDGETQIGDLAMCAIEEISSDLDLPEEITGEQITDAVMALFLEQEADAIAFPGIPIGDESESYAYFGVIVDREGA